ncbi:MAG: radical SAM protein [Desulfobacteraceae bacterium]
MPITPGKLIILYKWLLTAQPTTAAVDITHRCNLRCVHCYWWKQEHPPELSDRQMLAFLKGLKRRGLRAAILYGGEPTLRMGICMAAAKLFDATLIFTNGTNGFPALGSGQWILSLDGPEPLNDRIRGSGVYREATQALSKAPAPPIVHMTLSRLNMDSLEDFVGDMMNRPIKGIGFSFYTPQKGRDESACFIPLHQRDRLVKRLLVLRKRYGEKIGFTPAMGRQLLSHGHFSKWNRFSACPVSKRVLCFKSNGQAKACTYGDDADCSRCGCAAVAAYRGAFKPFDYPTLRVILGLMVPEFRVPVGGVR